MSNYCPCCDDFSIDASRARRLPMKKKKIEKFSVDKKAKKIVLNVDNSESNSDWIKEVKNGKSS